MTHRIFREDGFVLLEMDNMDMNRAQIMGHDLQDLMAKYEVERILIKLNYSYEHSTANDRKRALYYTTLLAPFRRIAYVTEDTKLAGYLHTFMALMQHLGTFQPPLQHYHIFSNVHEAKDWIIEDLSS